MTTEMHNGLPVIGRNDVIETHPNLGPCPAPGEIRFGGDLFETVAYRREWVLGFHAPHYPERFQDESECAARCRRVGLPMPKAEFVPVRRRIRWS